MDKFIIWENENGSISSPEHTHFEYDLGEVIRVNSSDMYKCKRKITKDGKLYQYFKQGKVTYNYNY